MTDTQTTFAVFMFGKQISETFETLKDALLCAVEMDAVKNYYPNFMGLGPMAELRDCVEIKEVEG